MAVTGWRFPVSADPATGRIQTVEDDEMVRQDLTLLLRTERGERPINETFGAGIGAFMFETIDYAMTASMSRELERSVKRWEAHARDLEIQVENNRGNRAAVEVDMRYRTDFSPEIQRLRQSLSLGLED